VIIDVNLSTIKEFEIKKPVTVTKK